MYYKKFHKEIEVSNSWSIHLSCLWPIFSLMAESIQLHGMCMISSQVMKIIRSMVRIGQNISMQTKALEKVKGVINTISWEWHFIILHQWFSWWTWQTMSSLWWRNFRTNLEAGMKLPRLKTYSKLKKVQTNWVKVGKK